MALSIKLRQLEILDAIISTGSITAAAERVLVSQPAVSKSLGALEMQVGFRIFDREGNRITLTEKGRALYEETRRLLGAVENFDGIVEDIRTRGVKRIRIATTQMIASSAFLATALAEFCAQHPNVRLELDAMSRRDLIRSVAGDRADIAIGYLPITSPDAAARQFGQSRICAVARRLGPLSDVEVVGAPLLSQVPAILLFERSHLRRAIDQYMYRSGYTLRVRAEVANGAAAIQLARAGIGVSLSDELSLSGADTGDLDIRPLDEELVLQIGFIHRLSGATSAYQTLLQGHVEKSWAAFGPPPRLMS